MAIKTMIHLFKDSRDLIYAEHYGQTTIFPNEINVDSATADTIQPPGNTMCTAITTCDIATDQMGVEYSYEELYSRVPHTKEGAEPRDILKEAVKNGIRKKDGTLDTKWKSYFRADQGNMDIFDNIRSAILLTQSPVALCTPWYWEWNTETILSIGKNTSNYHMYSCEGWKVLPVSMTTINGEPYLIIEAWIGRKQYMSREVCNKAFSVWGSQAWVLATDEIEARRKKKILEKIVDACVNAIITLKQLIAINQQIPMPPEIKPDDPKLYTITKSHVGKHLSLDESIPKEFGCAQCMSYILKEAGYDIPKKGISGTYSLYEWLNKNFYKTDTLEKGNIIISVTGTGNGQIRGHVGCVLDDKIIASNNSKTGLLDTHWQYDNWKAYYQQVGKLKTVIYKPKMV